MMYYKGCGVILKAGMQQLKKPESWPIVMGHTQWLEEVWVNLLSNALKIRWQAPVITLGSRD